MTTKTTTKTSQPVPAAAITSPESKRDSAAFPASVARIAAKLERFANCESSLQDIEVCIDALALDRGYPTPVEQFIRNILRNYQNAAGAMTPDMVQVELEQFREEYEELLRMAAHAIERFPEHVSAKTTAAA